MMTTTMIDASRPLTIDEAVAEFTTMVNDVLGDALPGGVATPETPQEAETRYFLLAQHLIGLVCPSPSACRDQRCRRDASCRQLAYVRDRWRARRSSHPRRPPGADLLRYAIWVYVSARRRGEGRDGPGLGLIRP
jgi:hypothetical protein